jgi:hypothetical protein
MSASSLCRRGNLLFVAIRLVVLVVLVLIVVGVSSFRIRGQASSGRGVRAEGGVKALEKRVVND